MKDIKPTVVVAIAIVVGAGGFFGGITYQKSKQATFRAGTFGTGNMMFRGGNNGQLQGNGQAIQRRGGMMGGGMIFGEIASIDATSMTIKTVDGGSKIVIFGSGTTYKKTVDGSFADIKQGDTVSVAGTTNSDGSVTATTVQLNPGFRIGITPTPSGR
jgi:hypothetical protein